MTTRMTTDRPRSVQVVCLCVTCVPLCQLIRVRWRHPHRRVAGLALSALVADAAQRGAPWRGVKESELLVSLGRVRLDQARANMFR